MSTAIKIKGGGGNILERNTMIGHEVGIDIEDSYNNLLKGNIMAGKEIMQIYGNNFNDVINAVKESHSEKDYEEILLALGNIINTEPDNAAAAWITLIKKFGTKIGNFSTTVLAGALSPSVHTMLKTALQAHSINLP